MGNWCCSLHKKVVQTVVESASSSYYGDPTQSAKFRSALDDALKRDLGSLSLSDAIQLAWSLDANRLKPDTDYRLDVQKGKKPSWPEDKAADPLFSWVNPLVWSRPTFATFCELLDNYVATVGSNENLTKQQHDEIEAFLEAIIKTGPIRFCHAYCRARSPENVPEDMDGFKKVS
jgi:poly(U)-specific endoribonuclease